jgi:site-specific recombinase XerC
MTEAALSEPAHWTSYWIQRFLDDMAVVRSANTVRAYAFDLRQWARFCKQQEIDPFRARPRTAIEFIRLERERTYRADKTVTARTVVRRLSAIRQWYAYLALEPEETGVHRNPIPAGNAIRTGAGVIAKQASTATLRPIPAPGARCAGDGRFR